MKALFRYVGIRHLWLKPLRALFTWIGICLGVALFISIRIVNQSALTSFQDSIESISGKTNISISVGDTGFGEERLEEVSKISGVKHAIPVIQNRAYFSGKEAKQTLLILGVDLLKEQSVRVYKTTDQQIIEDPLEFLNQPDSIILTHQLAQDKNLRMGSQLQLATVHGLKTFTVRGLLSPEGPAKAFGGSIAVMDIDGARAMFGKEGKLDRIDIVLQNPKDLDSMIEKISNQLGSGFIVQRPQGQSAEMEKMVASFQSMLSFFSTLSLFVGMVLVFNSVNIAVAERKREIGILRALGATSLGILILFLAEAGFLGVLGALGGSYLGKEMAKVLSQWVAGSMSAQTLTQIQIDTLHFSPKDIVVALTLGFVSAILAAYFPARKATQIDPIHAIREQPDDEKSSHFSMNPLWVGLGMGCLAYFFISNGWEWSNFSTFLQIFETVSAVGGALILGPQLILFFMFQLQKLFQLKARFLTRLAQDNLIRKPTRTVSNIVGLMIGLILVTLVGSLSHSFKYTLNDWFNQILAFDFTVSSNGDLFQFRTQPIHESLAKEISQVPGILVTQKTHLVPAMRYIQITYEGKKIAIKAFDPPYEFLKHQNIPVLDRPNEEAGNELFDPGAENVMVSQSFALHFKKKTGETLELQTPSGIARFKIVAMVRDYASNQGVLYLSRETYKKYWKDPLVTGFFGFAEKGKRQEVEAEIDRRFGQSKNLLVTPVEGFRKMMIESVDKSFKFTKVVEWSALAIALLGIFNTLLVSVLERTRELGMLRAVGMSTRQLFWMVFQESFLQGLLGSLVALILGSWLSYVWITKTLSFTLGWAINFSMPGEIFINTLVFGTAVAVIAGVYPAYRASTLVIKDTLDYE